MNDITTQAHNSLDTGNRFFVDNKKRLDKFDHKQPEQQLQERGTLSSGQKVRTFCATNYKRTEAKPASRANTKSVTVKEKQVDDQDQKPAANKDQETDKPAKAVTHEQDSKDSNTKLKCILKNVEPSKQAEYELHIKAAGPKIAALMGVLQGNDLSKPQVLKAEQHGDTKCLVLK